MQQPGMMPSNLSLYPQQTMFSRSGQPGIPQPVQIAQPSGAIPQAQIQFVSVNGQGQMVAPDSVVPQVQPINQNEQVFGSTSSNMTPDSMVSPDQEISDNKS